MKDVKLYINGKLVDCSEDLSLPITYTTEDLKNPTIVKNSFSKTITIPGTKENNKLFEEIYKLDRRQAFNDWNFNPSKRVDFTIYNNGDVVESGYVQLNTINIANEIISYEITLYGGLGDFFYGLKYNEDGTAKTLADIRYFIKDDNGVLLPADDELTFQINKDFVKMTYSYWGEDSIPGFVKFIPAYNGLYEDFDNEHCLINTYNKTTPTIFPVNHYDGSKTYTTVNGYAYAALNKSYTEWETRDLRSYMQRPAIKLSKLIESICREENSGYKVYFDETFFNVNNPYWDKVYVALPLLGSVNENTDEDVVKSSSFEKYSFSSLTKWWVGRQNGNDDNKAFQNYFLAKDNFTMDGVTIELTDVPNEANIGVNLDFQLVFHPEDTSKDEWFPASHWKTPYGGFVTGSSITAQLLVYYEDTLIHYSNVYNFTNNPEPYYPYVGPNNWNFYTPFTDAPVVPVFGTFKKQSNGGYYFIDENGNNTFRLTIEDFPKSTDSIKVLLRMTCESDNSHYEDDGLPSWLFGLFDKKKYNKKNYPYDEVVQSLGWYEALFDLEAKSLNATWTSRVSSNTTVTKSTLLKTEKSPADFLLDYCKLFGLYFVKDVNSKTINILSRNNFFKNNIVNWEDKIDYSKERSINPLMFDKKWYLMTTDTPDSLYANKYNNRYDQNYGQKRMDTGYNFNSDTESLYEENGYQNVISATYSDKYFRNFFDSNNTTVPAFMSDNISYTLYNGEEEYTQDLYGANYIDKTVEYGNIAGADSFPKLCMFTLDGDSQNLSEINTALVFYNGNVTLNDKEGNPIYYYVTDDVSEMFTLNDKACFLWTESETDESGNSIAYKTNQLPFYSRYYIDNQQSTVIASLDFGLPRETYMDSSIIYPEISTLYDKYWKNFYNDQFDVNTRLLTCYVKLDNVTSDMLRQFYYFNNSIWVLNKIDSYDVNSNSTVRCEFIKVQDINSYINGILPYDEKVKVLGESKFHTDYRSGTVNTSIWSPTNWNVNIVSTNQINYCNPQYGQPGINDLTISYKRNTKPYALSSSVRVRKPNEYTGPYITITQDPNPDSIYTLSGSITLTKPDDVSNVTVGIQMNGDAWEGTVSDDLTSYSITVPRITQVTLVYRTYGIDPIVKQENIRLTANTTKNLVL